MYIYKVTINKQQWQEKTSANMWLKHHSMRNYGKIEF